MTSILSCVSVQVAYSYLSKTLDQVFVMQAKEGLVTATTMAALGTPSLRSQQIFKRRRLVGPESLTCEPFFFAMEHITQGIESYLHRMAVLILVEERMESTHVELKRLNLCQSPIESTLIVSPLHLHLAKQRLRLGG
jgi:hypothetical protein